MLPGVWSPLFHTLLTVALSAAAGRDTFMMWIINSQWNELTVKILFNFRSATVQSAVKWFHGPLESSWLSQVRLNHPSPGQPLPVDSYAIPSLCPRGPPGPWLNSRRWRRMGRLLCKQTAGFCKTAVLIILIVNPWHIVMCISVLDFGGLMSVWSVWQPRTVYVLKIICVTKSWIYRLWLQNGCCFEKYINTLIDPHSAKVAAKLLAELFCCVCHIMT